MLIMGVVKLIEKVLVKVPVMFVISLDD